jgi:hypothetical protein
MGLKRGEITLQMLDGSTQVFKAKELSWYEESLLADENTLIRFQELCIEDPKLTREIWQNIPRDEGRRLLELCNKVNTKEKK